MGMLLGGICSHLFVCVCVGVCVCACVCVCVCVCMCVCVHVFEKLSLCDNGAGAIGGYIRTLGLIQHYQSLSLQILCTCHNDIEFVTL